MAVALLSPRDCLREDHRHTNLGRIYRPSAPLNFHEKKKQQQQQAKPKQETKRQQQAPRDPKRNNNYTKRNIHNNNKNSRFKEENANAKLIVPGQITILKRGEREDTSSDSAKKITEKRNVEKIADGRTVKNAVEEWAGPAYFNSPSPRCLPLPKFQVKNSGVGDVKEGEEDVDSFATQNLRRLLGLA